MKDSDIIKALECCTKAITIGDCEDMGCPVLTKQGCRIVLMSDEYEEGLVQGELLKLALGFINRQKAEIERLSNKCESVFLSHDEEIGQAKKWARAEAITEFEERLKAEVKTDYVNGTKEHALAVITKISKEVKEGHNGV